ncbi:MAG: hypothetical protein INR71_01570 [Terriglobus roseus]|nr:hypothetical protein [Terriglobus roseus]
MLTTRLCSCLRCLQSNLAYLAQSSPGKPMLAVPKVGPAIMDAPPTLPSMSEWYAKLKPLFPGWNGMLRPSPTQGSASLPAKHPQPPMSAVGDNSVTAS